MVTVWHPQVNWQNRLSLLFSREGDCVKSEIAKSDNLSAIFDRGTRLGEALAIVMRFIDNQWLIQQRLVKLQAMEKSMNAERLIQCLAVEWMIRSNQPLASMSDDAAVNGAALRQGFLSKHG